MTFKISSFAGVVVTQAVDTRTPAPRYKRSRVLGNRKPYWMFELTSVPLPYEEAMEVSVHLDSMMGSLEIFTMPPPLPALASRSGLAIYSTSNNGSDTIHVDGFAAGLVGAAKAGDFIQLSAHQKAYRVIETVDADSSGRSSIRVTPRLFVSTNLNEPVKYGDDVRLPCCLEGVAEMSVTAASGKNTPFDLTVLEQG